ncbi:MAG: IclR family transcriptional regulator [Granulosicoccus sp.]
MQSSIVQKMLVLLTAISEAQKPMTFSDIVRKCGLNKSTVHRVLAICTEEKMVRFDEQRKVYFLGSRIFDLIKNAHSGFDIQTIALDEMFRLFERYSVNVTLGLPSGTEVVYLRILEAPHSLGGAQRPGMREPMHCSASGKALLAFLPEKVIQAKLKGYVYKRCTPRTIINPEDFITALLEVRNQGFATNDREEYEHFLGISAPVFNYVSEPIAVINLWSVYPQHTIEDLSGWSEDLLLSASRVTELIGGVPPTDLAI